MLPWEQLVWAWIVLPSMSELTTPPRHSWAEVSASSIRTIPARKSFGAKPIEVITLLLIVTFENCDGTAWPRPGSRRRPRSPGR